MGVPLSIPDYLRAWERAPEKPCRHDLDKPCVPCLHRRLHNRRWTEANLERKRELVREGATRFRARHPDRVSASAEKQRVKPDHKAKVKVWNRSWVDRNPERHRELGVAWKAKNPDKARASVRNSMAKRRRERPTEVLARYRSNTAIRRARKRGAFVEHVDPTFIYERDGGVCSICGLPVPLNSENRSLRPSLDHKVPLARDGTHEHANVALAHALCNTVKHARTSVPFDVVENLRTRITGEG